MERTGRSALIMRLAKDSLEARDDNEENRFVETQHNIHNERNGEVNVIDSVQSTKHQDDDAAYIDNNMVADVNNQIDENENTDTMNNLINLTVVENLTVTEDETQLVGQESIAKVAEDVNTESIAKVAYGDPQPGPSTMNFCCDHRAIDHLKNQNVHGNDDNSSLDDSDSVSTSSGDTSSSPSDFDSDDSVTDPSYDVSRDLQSSEDAESSAGETKSPKIISGKRKVSFPAPRPEKKVKKSPSQPSKWKKNISKLKRNKGESYESIKIKTKSDETKEKVLVTRPAKVLLPPCTDKCKLRCSSKITQDERQLIFNTFWSLENLQRQRDFVCSRITKINTARRRVTIQGRQRNLNNSFHFEINGRKERVCKLFFIATLGINDRFVRTVVKKTNWQEGEKSVAQDNRGKHGNHHRVPEEIKADIRKHINSIPKIESHYCRAQSSKVYIEGGKTVAQLYRDYKNEQEIIKKPYGNYLLYHDIFNKEFNISFFSPKKDRCTFCVAFENSDIKQKENLQEEYANHLEEKQLSRNEKNIDRKSGNPVIIYDMQAILPCPSADASSFYYVSKVNVFNLTMFHLQTGDAKCFVWHEGEAQKGSNEIGTCVWQYLEMINNSNLTPEGLPNKMTDIIFYSDNCGGQNKNRFIFSLYRYATKQMASIRSITHKFLITGHTQNEGDNVHSVIEKQIKRSKKSGPIYIPEQLYALLRTAKKTGNPYVVHELDHTDIYDLKHLCTQLAMDGKLFNTDKEEVKISKIHIIQFRKEEPFKFFYKYQYKDDNFKTVNLKDTTPSVNTRSRRNNVQTSDEVTSTSFFIRAYPEKPKIQQSKKTGLLSLLEKKLIPHCYKQFYESL